jgi:hypothetical protein
MKKVIIAGVLVVFGFLGLWFYARPAYKRHRETRALEQAKSYLARGDYRNASLSARQTLEANPRNLEACLIMADLAEMSRSPSVLDWRRRVAEVAPTVKNRLMFASTAMRSQGPPYPLAAQILDELKDSAGGVAAYHTALAELALRLKRPDQAMAQF